MPLSAISRVEPVTAPTIVNTYNKDEEDSPFFHNYTGTPKRSQDNSQANSQPTTKTNYNKHNQIVFMERSVQDYLGQNLNIFG